MTIELRYVDHQRAGRGVIAMLDGDDLALTATLSDALHDGAPDAVTKMLLAALQLASEVLAASMGSVDDAAATLRASLGSLTNDALERGDPNV